MANMIAVCKRPRACRVWRSGYVSVYRSHARRPRGGAVRALAECAEYAAAAAGIAVGIAMVYAIGAIVFL